MTTEAAITLNVNSNGVYTESTPKWKGVVKGLGKGLGIGLESLALAYVRGCEIIVGLPWYMGKSIVNEVIVGRIDRKVSRELNVIKDVQFPKKWGLEDRATMLQILARENGVKMDLESCKSMVIEAFPELVTPAPKKPRTKRRSVSKTTVKKK
jgi:hypothetical protein